jgi:membrane-bound lytic murein transglycosylase B
MIRTITKRRLRHVARNFVVTALLFPATVMAVDTGRQDVRDFVDTLATGHGLDRTYLESVLADGKTIQRILDAISRPAEKTKPWYEYRAIFMTPERIEAGVQFWSEHEPRLARISAETGVPEQIITAIIGVETFYGRIRGNFRVLDALTTLGFDYPPRGKFFRSELEQLFLLSREEALDLSTITGSYAGAMGPPQFIPSSYRRYAVDGDGDGVRDLLDNWDDILASVANYFVANGWRPNQPVAAAGVTEIEIDVQTGRNKFKPDETVASLSNRGLNFEAGLDASTPAKLFSLEGEGGPEYWAGFHNFYVITRYNHSAMYALAVFQLAEALAQEMLAATIDVPDVAHRNSP